MKEKLYNLKINPTNPRFIRDERYEKLKQSIKDFPGMLELREIIVDENMIILGGNMRYKALVELGYTETDIKIAKGLTEEQKKEFIIKDNLEFGEWDWDSLANDWDKDSLKSWGLKVPYNSFDVEEDDFEPGEIVTDIQPGDLFEIGRHKLLCGDALNAGDVDKLMQGQKADLIFTDPPFDVESIDLYQNFKRASQNTHILIFASDKQIPFIFDSVGRWSQFKRLYVIDIGANAAPINNDVYVRHIALLRFKLGDANKFNLIFDGGFSIVPMKYRNNLKEGELHPHQKELDTLQRFLEYWSNDNNLIVDFFAGSGSVMLACHRLNRINYAIEKEPKLCQVIINRLLSSDPSLSVKKIIPL